MFFESEGEKLYSIREAAAICGCSRANLLKLEELDFLVPRETNESTHYRYYDTNNIMKVGRYQMFRELGMSQRDILAYYDGTLARDALIAKMRSRFEWLRRCIDELELHCSERGSVTFDYVELPSMTCYTFPCAIRSIRERGAFVHDKISEMMEAGFRPFPMNFLFSVTPDLHGVYTGMDAEPFNAAICLSVWPDTIPDPSKVARVGGCRAFAMTCHGEEGNIIRRGGELLLEEMARRGIAPAGPLYSMGVVGPYYGEEIDPKDYIFRFAIPVEEGRGRE